MLAPSKQGKKHCKKSTIGVKGGESAIRAFVAITIPSIKSHEHLCFYACTMKEEFQCN
jgi:uncharacterized protein (DUF362 family)